MQACTYVVPMLDLVIGVQAGGAAIGGAHWLIACIAIAQLTLLGHCADAHDGHAPEQIAVWCIRYTGLVRGIRWVSGTWNEDTKSINNPESINNLELT